MYKCNVLVLQYASLVFMLVASGFCDDTKYTTKYDNIDVDEILNNERIYAKYFDCLRGVGVCTPDGKELKDTLPDALQTGCQKCSEKQKTDGDKVVKFVLENRPEDYLVLEKIYDPDRKYRAKYHEEAEKRGFKFPDK